MGYPQIMITTLTKELDFQIANTYYVLQDRNQFYWGYYNTIVDNYCIFNDKTQVYLFFWQSTTLFLS